MWDEQNSPAREALVEEQSFEALRTSPPAARWIICGAVNSGKSRLLERLARRLLSAGGAREVGGVIARGVFTQEQKTGYEGLDLRSGEVFPYIARADSPRDSVAAEDLLIGPWRILSGGLKRAGEAVRESVRERRRWIFLDEFGPLEMRGGGLRPAFEMARASGSVLIVALRESLLEEFQALCPEARLLERL